MNKAGWYRTKHDERLARYWDGEKWITDPALIPDPPEGMLPNGMLPIAPKPKEQEQSGPVSYFANPTVDSISTQQAMLDLDSLDEDIFTVRKPKRLRAAPTEEALNEAGWKSIDPESSRRRIILLSIIGLVVLILAGAAYFLFLGSDDTADITPVPAPVPSVSESANPLLEDNPFVSDPNETKLPDDPTDFGTDVLPEPDPEGPDQIG